MPTGDVEINVVDGGGTVVVPSQSVQLVIGCASAGPTEQIVPTRDPNTLASTFGGGHLPEAAALSALKGGTILAMRAATNTAGSAGSVQFTGTGTSVITVTGTPVDDAFVVFKVIKGGTIGAAGITFQVSYDAGRNFGPIIALGTANTYALPILGATLNFAAGTLVAADTAKFYTKAPLWNTAGIQACLDVFKASQYALKGVGSIHIVGGSTAGGVPGTDASTLQTSLEAWATGYLFQRAIVGARDVAIPTAWGGPGGETEAQWISSIATGYSAVDAKRVLAAAGHYNMASAIPNKVAGAPSYRRSLAWALAARQVTIPPQRHAGRVRDGALSNLNIDPNNDPTDGFVYHDERVTPGLDDGRFCAARSRIGKVGMFISQPFLMAQPGSVFTLLPYGNVMDIACSITHQTGQNQINDDIRLNANGTIHESAARSVESEIFGALKTQMIDANMIDNAIVVVDRAQNVQATGIVKITITIYRRGYILEEDITIQFSNPFAAQGG